MAAPIPAGIVIAAILFPVVVVVGSFPTTFTLERAIPPSHELELSHLIQRDSVRHRRILKSLDGVVSFAVLGTFSPYLVGLYFTKVQLGSPPRDFSVQIDTGSDILWVNCRSCIGCPVKSGFNVNLSFYDPGNSSTASLISCSDKRCHLGNQSLDTVCSGKSNQCSYAFQYGDGSGTSGYYVSDLLRMNVYGELGGMKQNSVPVVFGCSTSQVGDLTKSDRAIDGIFGFGRQSMSVISQLSSQKLTANVFSHCLNGASSGGGTLVIGEVLEPNIVYTPLVPSMPHYNLKLLSIAVAGNTLPIDPSVFETSSTQGTIIDSGTTLAYLAQSAYDPLVFAITTAVSQYVRTFLMRDNQCYSVPDKIEKVFPEVSLNFAGGASMILRPQDYLVPQNFDDRQMWCVGFQRAKDPEKEITILGDLILKDKVIVYDLVNQRIGWAPYNCAKPVNVSANTTNRKSVHTKAINSSGWRTNMLRTRLLQITTTLLIHMFTFGNRLFL